MKIAAFLLAVVMMGCSSDSLTGVVVNPSPSPSPSPSPLDSGVTALADINARIGGNLEQNWPAGADVSLKMSLTCFITSTGVSTTCPFIKKVDWSIFQDPQTGCALFGEVNSDHPRLTCTGSGVVTIQATAIGFDDKAISISPLFVGLVGG